MTFTFNPDLQTERDEIRFALGDIEEAGALLTDELIDTVLMRDGYHLAVTNLGRFMLVRLALLPIKVTIGNKTIDYTGRATGVERVIAATQARIDLPSGAIAPLSMFTVAPGRRGR